MRVAAKFATGYGILLLTLVGLLVYHMVVIQQAVSSSRRLSVAAAGLTAGSIVQFQQLDRIEDGISKFQVTRDAEYLAGARSASAAFGRTLTDLQALPLAELERDEVATLAGLWARADEALAEAEASALVMATIVVEEAESGDAPGRVPPSPSPLPPAGALVLMPGVVGGGIPLPQDLAAAGRALVLLPRLNEQTRALSDVAQAGITRELQRAVEGARRAERISVVVLPLLLVFSLVVGWLFVRSISRSITRLTHGTRAVARGDFTHRLERVGGDEFEELATDFNRMTERLGELDQAKQDFLSHVSHELRTPLSSMQEVNRLLLEGLAGELNERQIRLLKMNLDSESRLSAMISRLLSLSRFDSGRLEYEFRPHDVGVLAEKAMQSFRSRAERDDRNLELTLPDAPVRLDCDGELLVTVMENLVDNALKWSPEGGWIHMVVAHSPTVPAWVPGDHARRVAGMVGERGVALLAVSDEGPGVPEAEKPRIFDRFYQARRGLAKGKGGVGLGLALCQEIVRGHGGSIWVVDRVGGGSVFHVLLPGAVRADRSGVEAAVGAGEGDLWSA
jgi:signal transduction histidine kinase